MVNKVLLGLAGAAIIFLSILVLQGQPEKAEARNWPGSTVTFATTTISQSVTAGVVELLAATSSCSARIIGTGGAEVRLSFNEETVLERAAANVGFPQTASTTVTYDAEVFGCGPIYVYPYQTGSISIMEVQ